jgi:hypothetical protein
LRLSEYVSFLSFMASHGLTAGTVAAILRQLGRERDGKDRWRRATLLDKLQFDVFAWYFRRLKPKYATFFANSTAHFQHLYWRNMEPELFAVRPTLEDQAEFASAVLFGYQEMDALVGRFYELCGRDCTLVFCTALSQQPCDKYEEEGGKVWYRPHDFDRLLAFAGVREQQVRISPVMSEQFHVYCPRAEDLDDVAERLRSLRAGDRPVLHLQPHEGGFMVGCGLFDLAALDSVVVRGDTAATAPFSELFYRVEGMKSGMHHPEGMLWIRSPQGHHREVAEPVPLKSIAPSVLRWLGMPVPSHMKGAELAPLS